MTTRGTSRTQNASRSPLIGVTTYSRSQPKLAASCLAFMSGIFDRIAADSNISTVILASTWLGHPDDKGELFFVDRSLVPQSADQMALLRNGLMRTIGRLTRSGKTVIVVGDGPKWKYDPVLIALTKSMPVRGEISNFLRTRFGQTKSDGQYSNVVPRSLQTVEAVKRAATEAGASYVDLTDRFCDQQKCRFENAGKLLFIDDGHLSNMGSSFAWQELTPAIKY